MEVEQKSGTLVFPTYIKDATMKLKKKWYFGVLSLPKMKNLCLVIFI